ncbi:putative Nitrogen regulation protein NR(I) [Desulfamplus magnetovallimortis]|uniref:DNA-binding transcriptional regulator NtrC n=1 Tax=Desulfamplus magnetovallimortis TaxID=1246637 RepID=A0A1W1H7I7_9BACT|nr:putative Nitrogen regulation protein NR(I) [Desulfamplus magnetovallimortis]
MISDIRMPVMDGLELAEHLKMISPETPLIFCTAYTETNYLLKAIEMGVSAFVRKPVDTDELLEAISKAALPLIQKHAIDGLSDELMASMKIYMGSTPAQKAIAEQAVRVAKTSFNILLQGETGTGKSRLATIIHSLSPRRDAPFITVQTGAMPLNLAESELFGHIKGSFTGADRNRIGLLEAADGGTIFLDDIESCPKELQAKLLYFVENKRFMQLGSKVEKKIDVRIISASNRNLKDESLSGNFREDLYYRLADTTIKLPPLRETRDAIIPLALKFLRETCDELGTSLPFLDENACATLSSLPWSGNIRQLKSVIRRAVLNAGSIITAEDIAIHTDFEDIQAASSQSDFKDMKINSQYIGTDSTNCVSITDSAQTFLLVPPPFPCSLDKLERWAFEQALRYCDGKRMKAASMLGMNYYTFRRRLEKHGITEGGGVEVNHE